MQAIIINNIIDSRIRELLDTISTKYPNEFAKSLCENEMLYIKSHIRMQNIKQKDKNKKVKQNIVIKRKLPIEQQCCGRVWHDGIFNKKTLKVVDDIDSKFKVIDFADLDMNAFNDKYMLGLKCKKAKDTNNKDSKYCKLHNIHLIHGDYLETPDAELCYHFIKDGKYLS